MIGLQNKKGDKVPFIGLGTFPFQGQEMSDIVKAAVKIGYRVFDTADDYRGESGIGMAIKEMIEDGSYQREDLFLQTKISDNNAHYDEPLKGIYFNKNSKFMQRHTVSDIVYEKVDSSLRKMNTDYLDSLLIHYPFPDYFVDIWEVLIQLKEKGIVRYIGVSNFNERHISKLISETGICPDINECYVSPIGIKKGIVEYCINHNCLVMTYSPLMDVAHNRIPVDKIRPMMDKYHKSLAQIVLRWNVERGCLPLPKTKNPKRLAENFDIFDFSLNIEEIATISSLNIDYQYLVESKICPGT